MPRPDRTIPQKKMLIGHEVIDDAMMNGRETDLGEFLAEAQMDFELFLLLDRAEDYKSPVYEGFIRGFGLFLEPRKIVTKNTLSWFIDQDGFSDFHAIMSEHDEIAELASEMSSVLEIYKQGGYEELRKDYNIFLAYSGQQHRLSNETIEGLVEKADAELDAELEKSVPNLKEAWEHAQKDRLIVRIAEKIEQETVKNEFLDCLHLHFRYALAGGMINMNNSRELIFGSLHNTEIDDTDIEAAITAVEYHAANTLRPD